MLLLRTDIAGYNIDRGPDGRSGSKINLSLTSSTAYSDSTAADRSTYYFAATAVDIRGMKAGIKCR